VARHRAAEEVAQAAAAHPGRQLLNREPCRKPDRDRRNRAPKWPSPGCVATRAAAKRRTPRLGGRSEDRLPQQRRGWAGAMRPRGRRQLTQSRMQLAWRGSWETLNCYPWLLTHDAESCRALRGSPRAASRYDGKLKHTPPIAKGRASAFCRRARAPATGLEQVRQWTDMFASGSACPDRLHGSSFFLIL